MQKVYGSSPQTDTLGIAEDFIVNIWRCKVRRGERGWMGQGLDGTEWLYVSSCNDRNISFSRFRKIK